MCTLAASSGARTLNERFVPPVPPSETSWIISGLLQGKPYRLAPDPWKGILERFLEPYRNHTPEWRSYLRGTYGPRKSWLPELCWGPGGCALEVSPREADEAPSAALELGLEVPSWAFAAAATAPSFPLAWGPRPESLDVVATRPCPRWKAPRPIVVARYAGERAVLSLTDCDGALASDALEQLSVLARPPSTPRPELPLPSAPTGIDGEWSPDVRLLHPRLAWVIGELARVFPARTVIVYSGYRRDGHTSFHRQGRALDLTIAGVPNEELFAACRRLRDVACGFYPNHPFVHVDVRPYGSAKLSWVDVSQPGEPSVYVDGWPGVLGAGKAWLGGSK